MKKGKKVKPEEVVKILREIDVHLSQGKTVALACKQVSISEHTYYRWRREFGGMKIDQAKEFKALKDENAKLKRLVADLNLDKLILKEALSGK